MANRVIKFTRDARRLWESELLFAYERVSGMPKTREWRIFSRKGWHLAWRTPLICSWNDVAKGRRVRRLSLEFRIGIDRPELWNIAIDDDVFHFARQFFLRQASRISTTFQWNNGSPGWKKGNSAALQPRCNCGCSKYLPCGNIQTREQEDRLERRVII